jgi:hypothetical protein
MKKNSPPYGFTFLQKFFSFYFFTRPKKKGKQSEKAATTTDFFKLHKATQETAG